MTIILTGRTDATLHVGDCLHYLRQIPNGTIDVCVTSPPYNIGVSYQTYTDNLEEADYLDWMGAVSAELMRVLAADGSLFLNVGSTPTLPWRSAEIAEVFRGQDWVLQNHIIWVKSIHVDGQTHGHLKPVNSRRFIDLTNEDIYHFSKSGNNVLDRLAIGVPYKDKRNQARFGRSHDLRCRGNSWFIPYETITDRARDRAGHPATFPIELPRRCIRLHGVHGVRTVLDPFGGIGTTLAAAIELGVRGIGIEMSHGYVGDAYERLSDLCDTLHGPLDRGLRAG